MCWKSKNLCPRILQRKHSLRCVPDREAYHHKAAKVVNTNFDLWENEVECPLDEEIASLLASLRELSPLQGMPSILDQALKGKL